MKECTCLVKCSVTEAQRDIAWEELEFARKSGRRSEYWTWAASLKGPCTKVNSGASTAYREARKEPDFSSCRFAGLDID